MQIGLALTSDFLASGQTLMQVAKGTEAEEPDAQAYLPTRTPLHLLPPPLHCFRPRSPPLWQFSAERS